MQTGLQRFIAQSGEWRAARLGLVTHAAAVLPDFTHAADALLNSGLRVTALFGPEHGLRGAALDGVAVSNTVDPHTGLPVYSLYGLNKEPTPEMLAEVEALVVDLQDVGARFYTYLSTLFFVLKGAASHGKPIIVLDRPNPLTGLTIEGPRVEAGCESFVGVAPLPIRHALTLGEAACYFKAELNLNVELSIVPMDGWRRDLWFDETRLPWVMTSPAMPHLSTAQLYPGMCLLEGTNLSEGRGTALPFEVCGAPWMDGRALAERLNAVRLPGVCFRAVEFIPMTSKHAGQGCTGVQVHVTDRTALRAVALGLHLIVAARALWPEHFQWQTATFDRLAGSPAVRAQLETGADPNELCAEWDAANAREFAPIHARYQLYE